VIRGYPRRPARIRCFRGQRRWHDATRLLCAFLILAGTSWPATADDKKPLTTILLVAREKLVDANFKGSTVLVMNNIGPAPVGVILNRPTRLAISQLFPDVEGIAHLQDKLYFGGPVEITSVSFVFRAPKRPEPAIEVLDGVYFSANRELLDELLKREKPLDGLRIFIGHSAWAPGQLEAEIGRSDWTLAPATADKVFERKSEHPWPERDSEATGERI